MKTMKRVATAAICAAGLTAGAVAMSAPAMAAGTATATYSCDVAGTPGVDYPSVVVTFQRAAATGTPPKAYLTVTAEIDPGTSVGDMTGVLTGNGWTGETVTGPVDNPPELGGNTDGTKTYTAPPSTITLTITPPTPPAVVTCTLVSTGTGWSI